MASDILRSNYFQLNVAANLSIDNYVEGKST